MSYLQSMLVATVVLQILLLGSVAGQHTGLFLSIRGTAIDNDSFVDLDSIGTSEVFRLLCLTNATDCCTSDLTPPGMGGTGTWFFPNGNVLPSFSSEGNLATSFSRERGPRVVSLIRVNTPPERGRFRCDLLGDTIYANILDIGQVSITLSNSTVTAGQPVTLQCSVVITNNPLPTNAATPEFEWFFGSIFAQPLTSTTTNSGSTYTSTYSITSTRVSDEGMYTCRLRGNQRTAVSTMVTVRPATVTPSITASGTNTAGETYSLVCSVTVAGLTNPPTPTITWSGPMNNPVPSETVTTTDSMSTLTFNPLSASHTGTYKCRAEIASLGGSGQNTFTVQVNPPDITAVVTPSSSNSLTLGQTGFSLTCDVSGTDNLNPTLTYEWRRNGGVVPNQQERTLSLSPLSGSHVGEYVCTVTVDSTLLNSAETRTSGTHTVSAQISSPSSVTVISDPIFFDTAGTDVSVICRVELGPAVTDASQITIDVRVTHNGTRDLQTVRPRVQDNTFIFTAIIPSFQAANDGEYVCAANVTSQSPFITGFASGAGMKRIGIGMTDDSYECVAIEQACS